MQVKKNPKADIGNWSSIFFLSGLALMLFISWQGVEWKSYESSNDSTNLLVVDDNLEKEIPITQQNIPPPPPPPPPPAMAQQVIEVIEDDQEIEETIIESTETNQDQEILEIEDIEEVNAEEEEIVNIPFAVIEDVPIYPGCESLRNNSERKKCLEEKVNLFVSKRFNVELAGELGLEGQQRIFVQFKIDKNGDVVDVKARAPHPRLEKEALDVVSALPKMIPGKQRGKPVGVLYALPILFKVEAPR
jgi:periplasmic protein TonB